MTPSMTTPMGGGISPLVDPRSIRHIGDTIERAKQRNQGETIVRVMIVVAVIALLVQLVTHHREKKEQERKAREAQREKDLRQSGGSFAVNRITFM